MPSVLVVDDHPDAGRPLARLLTVMGHPAAWVTSGPAALDFLRDEPVRLVLLDVMMPGMDGFDVLRAVRGDARQDGVQVVMCSAVADPGQIELARQLGAQDYLVKGVTPADAVVAAVERHVSGSAQAG